MASEPPFFLSEADGEQLCEEFYRREPVPVS